MLEILKTHPLEKLLKTKAKIFKKKQPGISLMQAQNIIAEAEGFNNWHDFKQKIKNEALHYPESFSNPLKEVRYIYSTIKEKPKKGYFLVGSKQESNLNVWSSIDTFRIHSVNFVEENSSIKYKGLIQFIKDGNACLLIDSYNENVKKIKEISGEKFFHINKLKLKAINVNKQVFEILLTEGYRSRFSNELKLSNDIEILKEHIKILFGKDNSLLFSDQILIRLKNSFVDEESHNIVLFIDEIIGNIIFSEEAESIDIKEGVFYIESPDIRHKYHSIFNSLLMWYLNSCVINSFSENETRPINITNLAIFYFNPVFQKSLYNSSLSSMLRAFHASIHYYISYESEQINNEMLVPVIIPNARTITFETVNTNRTLLELDFLLSSKSPFISMENKKKRLYGNGLY